MILFEKLLFEPDSKIYSCKRDYTVQPSDVSILAGKETLHGWLFSAEAPEALLLQFHGNAENLTSHAPYVGWLAEHGISVLCFDYAGYGKSSGRASMKQVKLDSMAAINFAHAESLKIGRPLMLLCQSIGSQFGLSALARATHLPLPKLVILEGAFPSIRSLVRSRLTIKTPANVIANWVTNLFSNSEDAQSAISAINTNFFIIHSKTDQIVPLTLGLQLAELVHEKQKHLWVVDGPRHLKTLTPDFPEMRKQFLQTLKAELRKP